MMKRKSKVKLMSLKKTLMRMKMWLLMTWIRNLNYLTQRSAAC